MPSLILSSRYSEDSQTLRKAAQVAGWETVRIDGNQIPDWFEPPDNQIAFFHTAPHVFELAAGLSRSLLGCDADWLPGLPTEFLKRQLRQTSVAMALDLPERSFVKHSVSKTLEAGIYNSVTLHDAVANLPHAALLHVSEPVNWLAEYRCFVSDRKVVATSPYRRGDRLFDGNAASLGATANEIADAVAFADSVLTSPETECPPGFVLDVGIIEGRGWAVIEVNECWASGIYSCDPNHVLSSLLKASVPASDETQHRWNFQEIYETACG